MNIVKTALSALLVATAAVAYADNSPAAPESTPALTPQEATIKQLVETRIGKGFKVESIRKADFLGLYEIHADGEVIYTDATAKYVFFGAHVVDSETRKDLTAASLTEMNKINFADLPFESSIKMVKGNGKRVIAVFEDPNCGYCKHLRQELAGMDNVTVYTFMYNVISADSPGKSKNVWCAPNRLKAWDDWMLGGKQPPAASAACTSNPNEQILALGHKLNITGTPTIFFTDGTRVPGAMESAALEEKWSSLQ